jgi:hypothetical protein
VLYSRQLKYNLFGLVNQLLAFLEQTATSFSFDFKVWSILQREPSFLDINGDAPSTVTGAIRFRESAIINVKKPLVDSGAGCCKWEPFSEAHWAASIKLRGKSNVS